MGTEISPVKNKNKNCGGYIGVVKMCTHFKKGKPVLKL
jgi:hypothetical protein